MQTNPFEDDRPLAWIPQENQFYEGGSNVVRSSQQSMALQNQGVQQKSWRQTSGSPERMPKTQALELVNVYKKRLIVASLVVSVINREEIILDLVAPGSNQPLDPVFPDTKGC